VNIEQQNKEPQNDEIITSMFDILCSIFCCSNRRWSKGADFDCFSPEFWILTSCFLLHALLVLSKACPERSRTVERVRGQPAAFLLTHLHSLS
jgi:hypothetical protein